jgi:hypothetical protein
MRRWQMVLGLGLFAYLATDSNDHRVGVIAPGAMEVIDENRASNMQDPDASGQTRLFRFANGRDFTNLDARKLTHYLETETEGANRQVITEAALTAPNAKSTDDTPALRPIEGPVVSLSSDKVTNSEKLLGAQSACLPLSDCKAVEAMLKGAGLSATKGRADDFSWPRADAVESEADTEAEAKNEPAAQGAGAVRASKLGDRKGGGDTW